MLAQGDQRSRVCGPIASLSSLVGASPAKSRQLLPQLSVPKCHRTLSQSSSRSRLLSREHPDKMGWEAKLAWPVEHKVGFTCLARGRARGDRSPPMPRPANPGAVHRPGVPRRTILSAEPSSERQSFPSVPRQVPGRARGAVQCCVAPRARAFARHSLGCRAATPRAGNSRSNRLRVSGSRSNQYVGSPSGAGAEPRSGRAQGVS